MDKDQRQIEMVKKRIEIVTEIYKKLIISLNGFELASEEALPYGLKPHTRSVSWIVEQVVNQQTLALQDKLGISAVNYNLEDTSLHDCEFHVDGVPYWVNIKTHNMDGAHNKNDIAAVERIYKRYVSEEKYDLIYVCLGIRFDERKISFDAKYIDVFSPQFLPIYVNPRNDKIQAKYAHAPEFRSRAKFLDELRAASKTIRLVENG